MGGGEGKGRQRQSETILDVSDNMMMPRGTTTSCTSHRGTATEPRRPVEDCKRCADDKSAVQGFTADLVCFQHQADPWRDRQQHLRFVSTRACPYMGGAFISSLLAAPAARESCPLLGSSCRGKLSATACLQRGHRTILPSRCRISWARLPVYRSARCAGTTTADLSLSISLSLRTHDVLASTSICGQDTARSAGSNMRILFDSIQEAGRTNARTHKRETVAVRVVASLRLTPPQ